MHDEVRTKDDYDGPIHSLSRDLTTATDSKPDAHVPRHALDIQPSLPPPIAPSRLHGMRRGKWLRPNATSTTKYGARTRERLPITLIEAPERISIVHEKNATTQNSGFRTVARPNNSKQAKAAYATHISAPVIRRVNQLSAR